MPSLSPTFTSTDEDALFLDERNFKQRAGASSGGSWLTWLRNLTLAFLVLSTIAAVAFTVWPAALTAIANVSFTLPLVNFTVDFAFMNSIGLPAASAIVGAVATTTLSVVSSTISGILSLISRRSKGGESLSADHVQGGDESDDDEDTNTFGRSNSADLARRLATDAVATRQQQQQRRELGASSSSEQTVGMLDPLDSQSWQRSQPLSTTGTGANGQTFLGGGSPLHLLADDDAGHNETKTHSPR